MTIRPSKLQELELPIDMLERRLHANPHCAVTRAELERQAPGSVARIIADEQEDRLLEALSRGALAARAHGMDLDIGAGIT